MRVLCLVDGQVTPPDRWLWSHLPESVQGDEVDFLNISAQDRFKKWGKLLTYYPSYIWLGVKAWRMCQKKPYDVVLAWEAKNGFGLAIIRNLLRTRQPKFVIVPYNHRGLLAQFPWFANYLLKNVDAITVASKWELEHYRKVLAIKSEKIRFSPLGSYDVQASREKYPPSEPFIFSPGRSYRDYGTFASALSGINQRVVINARKFNLEGLQFGPNVVINDILPTEQFWQLMYQASFVVVPLQDVPHAAGDVNILLAMSAGKAVIATRGTSTSTYVEDGVTGLLVPPKDPGAMHNAINYLLEHPAYTEELGQNGRKKYEEEYTFQKMAERIYRLLTEVIADR